MPITNTYIDYVPNPGSPGYPPTIPTGSTSLTASTTSATPTALSSSSGGGVPISEDTTVAFHIVVVARRAGGADSARWEFIGSATRASAASSTEVIEVEKSPSVENPAGWDCDVTADTVEGELAITATGGAYTVDWNANVELTEITLA